MTRGPDGQPVQIPGETENPAQALANAIAGMRESVALSATAIKKATHVTTINTVKAKELNDEIVATCG
jgi:hypothetical protein